MGANDGKSVGNAPNAAATASPAAGATAADLRKPAETPSNQAGGADDRSARGVNGASNSIELPVFEVETLQADDAALERAGNTKAMDAHPLAGIWEHVDGPTIADFAPGGYERSLLMLNPGTKTAAIYRVFRGSIVIVMGGEFALDVPAQARHAIEGTIDIRIDPSLSSRFPAARIPIGGDPPRFAEPPTSGNPWKLQWKRDHQQLVLDGRRYAPSSVDAFERIRRGGGDVIAPDELKETAPTRASIDVAAGPKPKQAAFFGVRGGGKRFVFIVDVSGSMQGAKLDRLKDELTKSVKSLADDAEFSIVFFAGGANVIDPGWMKASTDRDRAILLIGQQGCNGGTDPTQAFDFAFKTLSPIPDCIFFMTDGQIPPWTPDQVHTLNAARIPTVVHTIVIGPPAEEPSIKPLMERIAAENHGTYNFVPE